MQPYHQPAPGRRTGAKSFGFAAAFCCFMLAGCARGEWPSLSDKLPDPQERVLVRAEPTTHVSPEPSTSVPGPDVIISETDAIALLREVRNEVKILQAEYAEAAATYDLAAIPPQAGSRQELRHMWMNLQLQLTRVSQAVSRLNDILFASNLLDASLLEEASTLKTSVQDFVGTETGRRPAPKAG